MNRINWTAAIIFIMIFLVAFLAGMSLLGAWRYGGWGMMESGRMGPGMMNNWWMGPFGGLGMILMWLIPLGLSVLIIAGVVWIVRMVSASGGSQPAGRSCPNCHRAVQADWHNCAYCGRALE